MKKSFSYKLDLIAHLTWRDFLLRYKKSALGVLWSLLPPLAQLLVLVFLFRRVVPLNIDAYPAFVFSALLPWIWFSACLSSAGYLFINNRDLVRRPNFVPSILITVNTLSNLIHYLFFLPILFIILAVYGRGVTLSLLLLPVLLLVHSVLIAGLSLIISTLNVFYRDVQYMVNVGLMLLFYLTPVFYQAEAIPSKYRVLYTLNPMAVLVQSYRKILFYGVAPEWSSLLFTGLISVIMLGGGYLIYTRQLSKVMDMI